MKKKAQVGIHLPADLHEIMKDICAARDLNPARDLHDIYREAIEGFIERTDRQTGFPRRPTSWGVAFPSVCDLLDCAQFRDDAALFLALDEYPTLMTWVARSDSSCLFTSKALADYIGFPPAQFLEMRWWDLIHRDDRERLRIRSLEGYASRQPFESIYRIRRADGLYAWIVDSIHPHYRPAGRFVGSIGTMYDIGTRRYSDPPDRAAEFERQIAWTLNHAPRRKPSRRREFDIIIEAKSFRHE